MFLCFDTQTLRSGKFHHFGCIAFNHGTLLRGLQNRADPHSHSNAWQAAKGQMYNNTDHWLQWNYTETKMQIWLKDSLAVLKIQSQHVPRTHTKLGNVHFLQKSGVKIYILPKQNKTETTRTPTSPRPASYPPPPPPTFMMPRFLINFCGVWNPLGAISHFSKHPGPILGEWSK